MIAAALAALALAATPAAAEQAPEPAATASGGAAPAQAAATAPAKPADAAGSAGTTVAKDAPPAAPASAAPAAPAEGPDIELHVPRADIAKLGLDVENLQARLDVDTSVAGLVHISAGVVATVQKLKMQLEGVQAETHLVVRLDRVAEVMERALGTIDQHPEIALQVPGGPASSGSPAPTAAPQAAQPAAEFAQPRPAVSVDAAVAPRDAPPPAAQE